MKIHTLTPAEGAKKRAIRDGRGIASRHGRTAGRGFKGQHARGTVRKGFEGGQMPLLRTLPQRGFNNKVFAKDYVTINVSDLNMFKAGDIVDINALYEKGVTKHKTAYGLKVLGNGELNVKLNVQAAAFTKTAILKIEKAGGKAEVK